ncbi:MAG: DEAD/DEAH box helicase, partial [Mailhella sp.]|nr:DEAD/DEAH box helicase [Mailhella sp.]
MFDFSRFLTDVKQGEPALLAKSGAGTIARLAASAVRAGKRAVVVARDTDEAFRLKALLGVFLPDSAPGSGTGRIVSFLPSFSPGKRTSEDWSERLGSARSFVCGVSKVLILTCDNLLFKYPGTFFFYKHEFFVHKNEELSQEVFIRQLAEWGYRRASVTAHAGEFSRRGDIVDVLPSGMEKPVRLEFFGDVVDEMRIFDPSSQRSTEDIGSVCITPAMPFLGTSGSQKEIRNRTGGLFQRGDISEFGQAALLRAAEQSDPLLMPGMVSSEADFLEKLVPEDTVWFASGLSGISEALLGHETIWRDALEKDGAERRLEQPFYLVMRDSERAARELKGQRCISAEPLLMGVESKGMELAERTYHIFSDVFGTAGIAERPWQQMVLGIRKMLAEKRQVILAFSGERGRSKYLKLAERDGLYPAMRYDERSRGLFAVVAPCRGGVELVWDDCIVLGEDLLQPRGSEGGTAAKSAAFKGLNSSEGLEAGDFLVHRDYGVGRFGGLRRMAVGGVENDYLLIEYADGAKLYLPVDRLTLVQRFKTSDGSLPALDKLGGAAWKAGKEKARKAVEKIAADLVEMYAWRKIAKGFTYSPLGEMYNEFEASFGFEETPDQAKAIRDVLDDMEKPVPMDRLVCGDVGFGKTEVALRAAFRAACDGRQSALLCPTTVLAEQHYQTFRARLAGFPVNVGLLSRFVSKKQQTEILKAAEKGQIDILIGTHRILSGDVRLPNLS